MKCEIKIDGKTPNLETDFILSVLISLSDWHMVDRFMGTFYFFVNTAFHNQEIQSDIVVTMLNCKYNEEKKLVIWSSKD